MDSSKIEQMISALKPEEIDDALRMLEEYERWGGVTAEEAAQLRQRILARRQVVENDAG